VLNQQPHAQQTHHTKERATRYRSCQTWRKNYLPTAIFAIIREAIEQLKVCNAHQQAQEHIHHQYYELRGIVINAITAKKSATKTRLIATQTWQFRQLQPLPR
jgi:hypothetical protein